MAYEEPDTALHHLKMAKSYLDEAGLTAEISNDASWVVSDLQLRSLVQAALHLNKARDIDPKEVLWIEDKKTGTKERYDQDYLNGDVLLYEGVAHLNTSNALWSRYADPYGKIDRPAYRQCTLFLEKARDTLEKAARYRPYSTEIHRHLANVYEGLGDFDNYRRVVERRVELDPDNMALHKTMKDLNAGWTPSPSLQKPPSLTFNGAVVLCGLLGVAIFLFGAFLNATRLSGFGALLGFFAFAFLILKIIWREKFG